jgi:1,4-alpha-glucan branching enzyme
VRKRYRIALPHGGNWREALNSDSRFYGGNDVGNAGWLAAEPLAHLGRTHSLRLTLPPLAALLLVPE